MYPISAILLNLARENLADSDPVIIPYKVIYTINDFIWYNHRVTVRLLFASKVYILPIVTRDQQLYFGYGSTTMFGCTLVLWLVRALFLLVESSHFLTTHWSLFQTVHLTSGSADIGYQGSDIKTPHIDELARSGVILNQHYTQPQCSPSRAAFITGRYPIHTGFHSVSQDTVLFDY